MLKVCKTCDESKILDNYRSRNRNNRTYYESDCRLCEKEKNKIRCKKRYQENKEWYKNYSKEKKKEKSKYNKEYYLKNKDKIKKYKASRKKIDAENIKIWFKNKRKTDPCFKLRQLFSNSIRRGLKKNKPKSCLNYLDYSFEELKTHLESQFEPWMSWDNHGLYNSNWDDFDQSTWTWQIDHIIPQSCLPYDSFNHPNFKKCWCLDNLRPLSSKQNLLDGTRLTRHF